MSLEDLLKRVDECSGADRGLDMDLARGLFDGVNPILVHMCPKFTDSLDSALALVEEKLPGALRCVGSMEEGPFCRIIAPMPNGTYNGAPDICPTGLPTEPLAVLSALLRALLARKSASEGRGE